MLLLLCALVSNIRPQLHSYTYLSRDGWTLAGIAWNWCSIAHMLNRVAAAGCLRLTQPDPDHEIPDFDQILFEKLKAFCSIPFPLQLYEELLRVTSILTAFLKEFWLCEICRILEQPTAPTPDRQNPSAKAVWGMRTRRHCKLSLVLLVRLTSLRLFSTCNRQRQIVLRSCQPLLHMPSP